MGWNARFVLLAATLLALALPAPGFPEPIPPQPLWGQVEGAKLIVVARVESKERLRVLETWKGEAAEVLAVTSDENVTCPEPGRFEVGRTVLAFLTDGPDWMLFSDVRGRWHPVGLGYGTLYLDAASLDRYRTLVRDALALQRRGPVGDADRLAWLLRAAAHADTRWNGLLDLAQERRWDPVIEEWRSAAPPASRLTAQQRAELARAFIADPSGLEDLTLLLPMVGGFRDPRLEALVVEALDRAVEDPYGYGLTDALGPVARWAGAAAPALPDGIWYLTTTERRDAVRDAWFDLRTRILTRGPR